MRMFCLSASDVMTDTIWGDVLPFFEHFAERTGEISPDQVRQGAANSDLQVWGLQDSERVHAVAVTEISATPRGHICTIRVAAGHAPRPIQERLLDSITSWAKEIGCVTVRIVGRRGWMRRFPRFRQTAVVMECDL